METPLHRLPSIAEPKKKEDVLTSTPPLPMDVMLEVCEWILPDMKVAWLREDMYRELQVARATFAALALTCRELHGCATKYLYHTYYAALNQPAFGFLQTVSSPIYQDKPLVREIYVNGQWREGRRCRRPSKRALAEQVQQLAMPYKQKWLSMVEKKPRAIALALLVYRSRKSLRAFRLRNLFFPNPGRRKPVWLDPILQPAAGDFENLQRLDIDATTLSGGCALRFFLLPALKFLTLRDFLSGPETSPTRYSAIKPGSSNIQTITFLSADVPEGLLTCMLKACKALKSFAYLQSNFSPDSHQWYEGVMAALRTHSDSLERLVVWGRRSNPHDGICATQRYPAAHTLSGMHVLRTLYVDYAALVGETCGPSTLADILPPNVSRLKFQCPRTMMAESIDHMAQVHSLLPSTRQRGFPLQSISISYVHDFPGCEIPFLLHTLSADFRGRQITFEYNIAGAEPDGNLEEIVGSLADLGWEGYEMADSVSGFDVDISVKDLVMGKLRQEAVLG